jgi:hypothetical protein
METADSADQALALFEQHGLTWTGWT